MNKWILFSLKKKPQKKTQKKKKIKTHWEFEIVLLPSRIAHRKAKANNLHW